MSSSLADLTQKTLVHVTQKLINILGEIETLQDYQTRILLRYKNIKRILKGYGPVPRETLDGALRSIEDALFEFRKALDTKIGVDDKRVELEGNLEYLFDMYQQK